MSTNQASAESVFSLAGRTANKINSLRVSQEAIDQAIQNSDHPYWKAIEGVFNPSLQLVEVTEPRAELPPILTSTGSTFGEWLKAREELHKFFVGESIVLRDEFEMTDELLARTDIMPVFRPIGATNRMAINWKKKLNVNVWEEVDAMWYKNSKGPKVPQLSFIARSERPDENTLGENAKSPDGLIRMELLKGASWLNLYGWADADTLYFAITGKHLDPKDTVTWFPEDRLPDGNVVRGKGYAGYDGVGFHWYNSGYCDPCVGARLATHLPLKPKS